MSKITKERFEDLKRMLWEAGSQRECPVWSGAAARTIETSDIAVPTRFWSPRVGGVFTVPAGVPDRRLQIPDDEVRKGISSWIWERNAAFETLREGEEEEIPELAPDLIGELAKRPPLSTEQRIDRALRAIGRPPKALPGMRMSPSPTDIENHRLFMAATECGSDQWEMEWLATELMNAGLVRDRHPPRSGAPPTYLLTLKGLDRLETGGDALVSNTAFVAMWFNAAVDDAYENGIEPAVKDAGYETVRIDRTEHADKIDDRIIAEIRRCRFLVCDFTCGLLPDEKAESGETAIARGGVYYEAGFAHGLAKRVIWTCRSDLIKHVHFDLRQYNCIPWETGKEDDLRKKLYNRIRAEIH